MAVSELPSGSGTDGWNVPDRSPEDDRSRKPVRRSVSPLAMRCVATIARRPEAGSWIWLPVTPKGTISARSWIVAVIRARTSSGATIRATNDRPKPHDTVSGSNWTVRSPS